jgi:hypothetical protein
VRPAVLATLPSIEVAGLRVGPQTGAILPLAALIERIADVPIRGILGFDFLSRFVTRIDYAAQQVTFCDPDSCAAPAAATVEAPLANNLFSLPCAIDGCAGTVLLDTGAAGSLLGRDFSERCRLLDRAGIATSALGIAGEESSRTVRLDSLTVAGATLLRPAVALQLAGGSALLAGAYAGLLGNNVLERFTLTLDYARQRVAFEKGPYFDAPRPGDRSGLMLGRDSRERVSVLRVAEGSPAARAGIRPGDAIASIDGRPVGEWGRLYRVREIFRGETGSAVRLVLTRDGKRREAELILADYF